jgi:hypothetical protein
VDTAGATITVAYTSILPVILTQPQPISDDWYENNNYDALSVFAVGPGPLTYQWYKDNVAVSGATASQLDFDPGTPVNDGTYTVAISNANGSVTSIPVTVAFYDPPAITTQPASQTVAVGGTVSFSVSATGSDLSYSWRTFGIPLPPGTGGSPTLTLTNVQPNQAGSYYVFITNSDGAVTSAVVTLTVITGAAPSITTQPQSQSAVSGSSVTFTAAAGGTPAPTYQWLFGNQPISGATNATLTLTNVSLSSAGPYSVIASNFLGSATSSSALLTVNSLPNITSQPASASVAQNQSVTFTVVAFGDPAPAFQWQKNGVNISGATSSAYVNGSWTSTYTLPSAQPTDAASYDVIVSNLAGQVTSNVVTLTVSSHTYTFTTMAGTALSTGSVDGTGSAARFDNPVAVAVDGSGNVYVADSANATIRKITPGGVVTTFAGTAGAFGSADGTGSAARFGFPSGVAMDGGGNLYVADWNNCTIRKITAGGVVTTFAGTAGAGGSADGTGSAARFGDPNGVAVDGAGNVYVADTGNQTIRKITSSGVVTTLAGKAGAEGNVDGTGSAARFNSPYGVAVDGAGNVYVADAGNATIREITPGGVVTTIAGMAGSAASFLFPCGVAVDGSGNVYVADTGDDTIREIAPGGAVTTLAGATGVAGGTDGTGSAALFKMPHGVSVDGSGNLYVADWGNSTIRKGASVGPMIAMQPSSLAVAAGSTATFSVGASGSTALNYQWQMNGVAISGATGATYTIANAQVSSSGSYTVVVTNSGGSITSSAAMLTINAPSGGPTILAQPVSQTMAAGSTVVFSATAAGTASSNATGNLTAFYANGQLLYAFAPTQFVGSSYGGLISGTGVSYRWYLNGVAIAGATDSTLLVQNLGAANAGSYNCLVSNSSGSTLSSAAVLTVTATTTPGRLFGLSVNSDVGSGSQQLTLGFVTGGAGTTGSQSLLIRANGPSLASLLPAGVVPMPDPSLTVCNSALVPIYSNTGWAGTQANESAVTAANAITGDYPLTDPTSKDSAAVVSLTPDPFGYTVNVGSVSGAGGTTLAQIYDNTPAGAYTTATPRLISLSCKVQLVAQGMLTAGFAIEGYTSKTVLIRASGPALAPLMPSGSPLMPDPQLNVFNVANQSIATNAGWGGSPEISAAAQAVGDFAYTNPSSADSAVLLTLAPGGYSAQVSSISGTAGYVLVEVYEVP